MECRDDFQPLDQTPKKSQLQAQMRSYERMVKRRQSIEAIWCEKCKAFQAWGTFEMWNVCRVCGASVGWFAGEPDTPVCYRDDGDDNCTQVVIPYKIKGRIHRR